MENKQLFDEYQKTLGKLTQKQVDSMNDVIDNAQTILGVDTRIVTISQSGIDLIKQFEGFSPTAYMDAVGIWTIGYGTIRYPNGVKVQQGDTCTKEQAEQYLIHDTKWVVDTLKEYSWLKQNQIDALASLIYNIGRAAFKNSTIKKYIDSKHFYLASKEFDRWNKAGGRVIKGLVVRRAKERKLFEEV